MTRQNIDLYQIGSTPEALQAGLIALRQDFDAHIHDGTSARAFETLNANTISTQTFLIKKTSYADTTGGIWMGFVNGVMKLKLGTATQFLSWDGSILTVTGTIAGTAFTGITITSSTISGTNVTGGTIKTSNTTTRVELNGTDNALYFYLSGNITTYISGGVLGFNTPLGIASGSIYGLGTNKLAFDVSGSDGFSVTENEIEPFIAGTMSLGTASLYWNDVSYKTLTDRGCLGWYDDGVELMDGTVVRDIEALQAIRPHPTRKTPKGKVRMDYQTMPKHVYVPATQDGKLLPRDENDEPYFMKDGKKMKAEDGAETTALLAIMIGAIKELDNRLKKVEA